MTASNAIDCAVCDVLVGQRAVYNGWKRAHGWKYQAIQCPDGIMWHLAGPYEGRHNDTGIFGDTQFEFFMEKKMQEWGVRVMLYADAGYRGPQNVFIRPHDGVMTPQQEQENRDMSCVRVCVEHSFAKVCNLWPYLMHYRQMKTLLQPVGRFYQVAVLLTNAHTCVYSSETSKTFNATPPTLEDYLRYLEDSNYSTHS